MVPQVGLQGVARQLEVDLLLLPALGAKHPLPQVRVVEVPGLTLTGATQKVVEEVVVVGVEVEMVVVGVEVVVEMEVEVVVVEVVVVVVEVVVV